MKGYSFLEGSLLGQRTYLEEKNCLNRARKHKQYMPFRQRNTSQEHVPFWLFASSVNCDLGGQWAVEFKKKKFKSKFVI